MQSSSSKPFISLTNVSVRVQDKVVFEDLSWQILGDQHWAMIGPNGSGKSTLMRAVSGSLPIVSGRIDYHFSERDEHAALVKQIAYVDFETQRRVLGHAAFHQERWNTGIEQDSLSVDDFLSARWERGLNPFISVETQPDEGYSKHRSHVIDQLELGELLGRKVVQLSNGERRKFTIARALLKNPRLLILDSPFNGLDERFCRRFSEQLDRLMSGDLRVIIVGTNRDLLPRGITNILRVENNRVSTHPATNREKSTAPRAAPKFQSQPSAPIDASRPILVQMRNVNVAYNGTPILHRVNWVVCAGERWALLGPNGAGKTTLLSLILADNPQAYANDITLFGQRRGTGESIWEIKRNIGWVAPELQLYYPRRATCLDVACSGWFESVGLYRECSLEQRTAAEKWLREFGMSGRAEDAFDKVSEGEQRLALLARALVKEPQLLVLDEPCQGLDPENRDRVLAALERVRERTMIYVTHRADEMPHSISHVLRLEAGLVVDGGSARGSWANSEPAKSDLISERAFSLVSE